jgi:hypothetical protein
VTVDGTITSVLGTENFVEYEQNVYEKYQEMAEREIIAKLNSLLSNIVFQKILKQWGVQCACRFLEYREITIRLKSGRQWKILSPVFLRAKPKKKRGRSSKRQKGALRHLGLELLGIIKRISPALIEICVSILICVDGGRIRERRLKRGKRKKGQKRQGYHTDWFEPRLLTISQFDEDGKKIKSVSPILDGSCGSLDDFFELLKEYLLWINLDEASEIIFCADGGNGIWPRIDKLISELGLSSAKRILDYTHAKLSDKESRKLSKQIREMLWHGNIDGIADLVREKLPRKRKTPKAALKKLNEYFGDHSRFQYKTFRDNGLPTSSGTVESAIRRVINLRIKGTGLFWKREHAENIIFLRSLVLTGKLKNACRKVLGVVRNMFDNNTIGDLPLAA